MNPFKLRAVTPYGRFEVVELKFFAENGVLVRMKDYPHESPGSMTTVKFEHLEQLTGQVDKNQRAIWEGDRCRCRVEVAELGTDVDLIGTMRWRVSVSQFVIEFESTIDMYGKKVKEVEVIDE